MLNRPLPVHLRTLFISDIHLGTRGCKAEHFLEFLAHYNAETIFLIGDIIDGWRLKRGWFWPQTHTDVVQALIRKAQAGTRIVYLPGNHDEFMRQFTGYAFGEIEVAESFIYDAADGRRMLIIHGDQFDVVVRWAPWLSALGAQVYNLMLAANGLVNRVRRLFGNGYWSLADWAKQRAKNTVNIIGDYEAALVKEAQRVGADGVICGHIHHAAIHDDFGIRYVNTGDWMESCTAIAEHDDGRMEIIRWTAALPSRVARRNAMPSISAVGEADTADAA